MAEIKRYKPSETLVRPIGVVKPQGLTAQAMGALANAAGQASDMFYKQAVKDETQKGQLAGAAMVMRDAETGKLKPYSFDAADMSSVAAAEAENVYRERYAKQLTLDTQAHLQELANNNKEDPVTFATQANAYIEGLIESEDPQFKGVVADIGQNYTQQFGLQIMNNAFKASQTKATENNKLLISSSIRDLENLVTVGSMTDSMIQDARSVITTEINNAMAADPSGFTSGTARDMLANLDTAVAVGNVRRMAAEIGGEPYEAEILNRMSQALSIGQIAEDTPEAIKSVMNEIGFTNEMISSSDGPAQRAAARILSQLQGQTREQQIAENNMALVQNIEAAIGDGVTVSSKSADIIMTNRGIQDSVGFLANFPRLMKEDDTFRALMLGNSELPTVVTSMFNDIASFNTVMASAENPQAAYVQMVSIYDSVTQEGDYFQPRGMTEKSIALRSHLRVMENLHGSKNMARYVNELITKPATDATLQANLGSKYKNVGEFVSSMSPTGGEAEFLTTYATELLKVMPAEQAENVLDDIRATMFVESNLFPPGTGKTAFAPRHRYHMPTFNEQAAIEISKLPPIAGVKYELGKNVFLKASNNSAMSSDYFLVDENGFPIDAGMNEPIIKHRVVHAAQQKVQASHLATLREEAGAFAAAAERKRLRQEAAKQAEADMAKLVRKERFGDDGTRKASKLPSSGGVRSYRPRKDDE